MENSAPPDLSTAFFLAQEGRHEERMSPRVSAGGRLTKRPCHPWPWMSTVLGKAAGRRRGQLCWFVRWLLSFADTRSCGGFKPVGALSLLCGGVRGSCDSIPWGGMKVVAHVWVHLP